MDKELRSQILRDVQTLIVLNQELSEIIGRYYNTTDGSYRQQETKREMDTKMVEITRFIQGENNEK